MNSEFICATCNAGPWAFDAKGFNNENILQLHASKGHDIETYDPCKHESLKDGVKVSANMNAPANEPMEYEKALRDAEKLEKILEEGIGDNSPDYALPQIAKLFIITQHKVSKIEVEKELILFCKKWKIELKSVVEALGVFEDPEVSKLTKEIAYKLGRKNKDIVFARDQVIETAWWLMGKFHTKRIELTGDVIWYNGQYYQRESQEIIRRTARDIMHRPKNADIVEVWKFIEDRSKIITWKDIEKWSHVKCLLNGEYDIERGVFTPKFSPDHIILQLIPHNYDEDAKFDTISLRVSEIIVDDKIRQSYYDHLSTCLHPFTGIDFQFGGIGIPGSGKSSLDDLSETTLGEDNVSNAPIHLIASDMTTQKHCAFKMLNIDPDLSRESIKNIDVLKKWITQDPFTARGIYEQNIKFRPMARLSFMANELYEIVNQDDAKAMYERTHLGEFNIKFRGTKKQIRKVFKKIDKSEYDGFITYLLKNAHEIYKIQNIHYPQSTMKTESIWNSFGNAVQEWAKRNLDRDIQGELPSLDAWNSFFAERSSRSKKTGDKNKFLQKLSEHITQTATKHRIKGTNDGMYWGYTGYRIKTVEEIENQERIDATPKGNFMKKIENLDENDPLFEKLLRDIMK